MKQWRTFIFKSDRKSQQLDILLKNIIAQQYMKSPTLLFNQINIL